MYNQNKHSYEVDNYHVIELELSGSNRIFLWRMDKLK